jgi:4-oxalmesaconate hydratase
MPGLGGGQDNERFEVALRRLYFDTVLHHPLSLELLLKVVGVDRCLFGTERPGSGSATNPATGQQFDDIKTLIDGFDFLSEGDRRLIYHDNARAVFPKFKASDG